ncbi:proto-oncogene tyrosine-protein kinase ROS-like [Camponotus floridanus]|uniref:proto-oncogene tyrosine-protein kinase ROS-like n=1 Tax=Camponotus floridanus TaxID=104421 RepID=UPI000DC6722C|nr:proto-oncogene tyrosine-protein kinase ROS-like [Camponotus floridanus]
MQIMFGTILCVLLKSLILTKATNTPKVDITSNILQEENVSMYPYINFTQDISMSEKSDQHILNFKSDRSYSDSMTVRNEREVDEVPLANISITPESIESKPTSLRAFVQFDSQFIVNDIFVTLRWNQPEFTDEIIQGYTVQCFFIENLKEIQICDDKNITTIKLEHTVHNLTSNTTYYFRVRAHTKIVAGLYTDLINVSTTHENPIPKLLVTSAEDVHILDMDLNITDWLLPQGTEYVQHVAYSIQEHRIYFITLTPLTAVVHWMHEKLSCAAYEVHWKSIMLMNNGMQHKSKQFINVPKRMADGRFFTKINLSLPVQDYLIYFRLILRYPEYKENFTWPTDERFIFSTRDISNTSGIIAKKYYLLFMLSFIVIITIICCFYYLYRQRRGNSEQFFSSTTTNVGLAILHEVPCRNTQFNMLYSPMLHYNPDECTITKIARNQITFTKHLGSGAFGMVYQGKMKDLEKSGTEMSVAIKTLRKDATSREKEKFLKEAKLMNHFQHKHILRLLAICLDGDPPLLVLELMETDLLQYLRDCRNLEASDSPALRLQDLLAMCEDVARGCCYLEELRFVHRDLACRNCLVSSRNRENRVIKIGDFGLARDIYKDDYYRVKGEGLFPIRWMAPESLIMGIFTSQSDVWSFGILMWEITSLGEQPYSTKTNEEVTNYVRAGGRLSMTPNCPSTLYQLMLRCWKTANARPNFNLCLKNIIAFRKNTEDALLSPVDII